MTWKGLGEATVIFAFVGVLVGGAYLNAYVQTEPFARHWRIIAPLAWLVPLFVAVVWAVS